jgi:hypothetical protein
VITSAETTTPVESRQRTSFAQPPRLRVSCPLLQIASSDKVKTEQDILKGVCSLSRYVSKLISSYLPGDVAQVVWLSCCIFAASWRSTATTSKKHSEHSVMLLESVKSKHAEVAGSDELRCEEECRPLFESCFGH